MSDGIGKIVEGYNSVISALENNRVLELVTLGKNIDSKKVKDLIEIDKNQEEKVIKMINFLEELEDVQNVYTNYYLSKIQ